MRSDAGRVSARLHSSGKLVHPNAVSWEALIANSVKGKKLQCALTLYDRIHKDGAGYPSVYTFVALLKACTRSQNLLAGLVIHNEVVVTGEEGNNFFVGSILICMYAECGSLTAAQQVFNRLRVRNVVSWNALITAHVKHGCAAEALNAFREMKRSGVTPSRSTYIAALKACGSMGLLTEGQDIHSELERNGTFEKHISIGNTLIDMYTKCRLFTKAQEVFDRLAAPTGVSWNALISGYLEHDYNEEALRIFKQMQSQKFSADSVTFICSLKACGSLGELDMGESIHAEIERKGWLEKDSFVGNALVGMYAKCGALFKAQEVFDDLFVRDVIAWNALITAYVEHGLDEEAICCLKLMQSEDVSPDSISYIGGLQACGSINALDEGQGLHAEIERRCLLIKNHFCGSAIVDLYAKCGSFMKAKEVLERIPIQNVVAWTALISGYAEHAYGEEALKCFEQMQRAAVPANAFTYVAVLRACGSIAAVKKGRIIHEEIERIGVLATNVIVGSTLVDMYTKCGLICIARQVFDQLPEQDVIAWTSLATAYAENGQAEETVNMLDRMQILGIVSDEITLLCSLKVCGLIGATKKGANVHAELARKGLLEGVVIGNMLVDMYSRCGAVKIAQQVFDRLLSHDVACWNSLIAGYVNNEGGTQMFKTFSKMLSVGLRPDQITFLNVLHGCALVGLVAQGQIYFEAMENLYGITPLAAHYNCIIDSLCQAGHLNKALALAKQKDLQDVVTWRSILGACKKWIAVEEGLQTFETNLRS